LLSCRPPGLAILALLGCWRHSGRGAQSAHFCRGGQGVHLSPLPGLPQALSARFAAGWDHKPLRARISAKWVGYVLSTKSSALRPDVTSTLTQWSTKTSCSWPHQKGVACLSCFRRAMRTGRKWSVCGRPPTWLFTAGIAALRIRLFERLVGSWLLTAVTQPPRCRFWS
jgi:hypothetical protein